MFLFSHQNGNDSKGITYKTIEFGMSISEKITGQEKNIEEKESGAEKVFNAVRKSAHFFEYFILAILFISLLQEHEMKNKKNLFSQLCFLYYLLLVMRFINYLFLKEVQKSLMLLLIPVEP